MFCSLSALSVWAAPQTLTGRISDSMCGKDHSAMGEMGKNPKECALACVKGGAKYVFAENVLLHFRVPALGLVSKVNASLKQFLHGNRGQIISFPDYRPPFLRAQERIVLRAPGVLLFPLFPEILQSNATSDRTFANSRKGQQLFTYVYQEKKSATELASPLERRKEPLVLTAPLRHHTLSGVFATASPEEINTLPGNAGRE
jgi:hypothetical protein